MQNIHKIGNFFIKLKILSFIFWDYAASLCTSQEVPKNEGRRLLCFLMCLKCCFLFSQNNLVERTYTEEELDSMEVANFRKINHRIRFFPEEVCYLRKVVIYAIPNRNSCFQTLFLSQTAFTQYYHYPKKRRRVIREKGVLSLIQLELEHLHPLGVDVREDIKLECRLYFKKGGKYHSKFYINNDGNFLMQGITYKRANELREILLAKFPKSYRGSW